jgi:hypothetical protein
MTPREVAERFAAALDADNYSIVASLLHRDCTYDGPHGRIEGRRDITGTYWRASKWAKERFAVRYESAVLSHDLAGATIEFKDHLTHKRGAHTHACRQSIQVEFGHIIHIDHHEIDGEKLKLEDYFLEVQVARDLKPTSADWGINFGTVHCPDCFAKMAGARMPRSWRQMLWGGWTCPDCGCEMDKWGKAMPRRVKRSGDQSGKS